MWRTEDLAQLRNPHCLRILWIEIEMSNTISVAAMIVIHCRERRGRTTSAETGYRCCRSRHESTYIFPTAESGSPKATAPGRVMQYIGPRKHRYCQERDKECVDALKTARSAHVRTLEQCVLAQTMIIPRVARPALYFQSHRLDHRCSKMLERGETNDRQCSCNAFPATRLGLVETAAANWWSFSKQYSSVSAKYHYGNEFDQMPLVL